MILTTAIAGKAMITTGLIGLTGLSLLTSTKYSEYVVDKKSIKNTLDIILPNDINIFYIEDEEDLTPLSHGFSKDQIDRIKYHYFNRDAAGMTFKGCKSVVIFVGEVVRNCNSYKSIQEELYKIIFHELYHLILDTDDEKLVIRSSNRLYRKHKHELPLSFVHFDCID